MGSTNDLRRRLTEHNKGTEWSTKRYKPWSLVYYEAYQSEKDVREREMKLKHHGNAIRELKKRIQRSFQNGAGFTLVELLVVIAIIGVLAAVLLIGINPVEQINKAKDAGKLSRGKEIISGAERYCTSHGANPADCTALTCAALVTARELKSGICGSGTTLVTVSPGTYTVTFTPESQTYRTICQCGADTTNCCTVPTSFQPGSGGGGETCSGSWWGCQGTVCNNYGPTQPTCTGSGTSYCNDSTCGGGCTPQKCCTNCQ